jgi:maltose alpha-D-glucosyltransferase/alpha-amylase
VSAAFLRGYLEVAGDAPCLPSHDSSRQMLLDVFLLEKALYELGYELATRPDWARIPMEGILSLMRPGASA